MTASSSSERRKHRRVPVDLNVRHRTPNELVSQVAAARDVSPGGVFLKTQKTMPIGATLEVGFELPDRPEQELHARGRVVRVNSEGVAVEFVELDFDSSLLLNLALSV